MIKKYCPITYEEIEENRQYSFKGLKLLSPKLTELNPLTLTAESQRFEARQRADKMSIQGVQLKLSAILNIRNQSFEICDRDGLFILKPPSEFYLEVPQNEDLSMHLANEIGIEVPLHGLLYCIDGSYTYFIRRFDRAQRGERIALEDFSQLAGFTRDTKYNFSMEKLIPILNKYCTFSVIEKKKLLTRAIFNFIIGNEDMHLKNFSLISRDNKIELAPAYDFVNTTLAMGGAKEEIALPLNGKKRNLKKSDFIDYYAKEKLQLNDQVIEDILNQFIKAIPNWKYLIEASFLSPAAKINYHNLIENRFKIFDIDF